MKTKNEILYDQAWEALKELFFDQSVSVGETKINLETLIDEITIMLQSLGTRGK